jgi:hypothetical protein
MECTMKAKKQQVSVYKIELSEVEARMLRSLVQNSTADDETKEWSDFRRTMFEMMRQVMDPAEG